MTRSKTLLLTLLYLVLVALVTKILYVASHQSSALEARYHLILSPTGYSDQEFSTLWQKLQYRISIQPFNLVAFILFCCTLLHIFFAPTFTRLSHALKRRNEEQGVVPADSFWVEILGFMGEVEVIFGLWVIPLMLAMTFMYDWKVAIDYLNGIHYAEPLFVFVIMVLASTQPIITLAEDLLRYLAVLGGKTVKAWWFSILTLGPLLGSFITEPAAMTIAAILLGHQFYRYQPSRAFSYGTLGLLFTNISVGGVLTNFAAPPVLMISKNWDWSSTYMLTHFGWKAVLGILISTTLYFFYFQHEFAGLEEKKQLSAGKEEPKEPIPFWISFVHIVFLAWIVVHANFPVVFIGSFLLYLGFFQATSHYQSQLKLRTPILVGFFLAGLVVHGTLQAWWMAPILQKTTSELLMLLCIILTAFNDNAEITYLASLTPGFSESLKYAVLAGAVTGGGLTVIANAPNLSGQALLRSYFEEGVSVVGLFLAALTPTIVMALSFYLLRNF